MGIGVAEIYGTLKSVVVFIPRTHESVCQCIPKQGLVVEIGIVVRDVYTFPAACGPDVETMHLSRPIQLMLHRTRY